jgi:hypothetical protein
MNAPTRISSILAAALVTAATAVAAPGAGIVDIDQAKVPFTITAPGSYACEIVHCVVSHNGGNGILMNEFGTPFGRGIVSSSIINANGIFGIAAGTGVLVTGNSINGNVFDGLSCRVSTSGYSNNVFDGNGFPASGCVNLGQNACDGTICQ